jgi:hypothetical protein
MRSAGVSRAVDAASWRPYEGLTSGRFRAAMTTRPDMQLAHLRDPRLAAHALSPAPAWLWREDGSQILWANPTGGSIFGAGSPGVLAAMRFDSDHSAAAQVRRLSGTLPRAEAPRLERLRGFGAHTGAVLICLCSRVTLADNSAAILVISTERAGRDLALPDQARCLLQDLAQPSAMFTADGELIEEQHAAKILLGSRRDILALGAESSRARQASMAAQKAGLGRAPSRFLSSERGGLSRCLSSSPNLSCVRASVRASTQR